MNNKTNSTSDSEPSSGSKYNKTNDKTKDKQSIIQVDTPTFSVINNIVYIKPDFSTKYFLNLYDINNVVQLYKWLDNNIDNEILTVVRVVSTFMYTYKDSMFTVNDTIKKLCYKIIQYVINVEYDVFNAFVESITVIKDTPNIDEQTNAITCKYINRVDNLTSKYEYTETKQRFFKDDINNNVIPNIKVDIIMKEYYDFINKLPINTREFGYNLKQYIIIRLIRIINGYLSNKHNTEINKNKK